MVHGERRRVDRRHKKAIVDPPRETQYDTLEDAFCEYLRHIGEHTEFSVSQLAARFPGVESALTRAIDLYEAVAENPRFASLLDGVLWPSCGDQIGVFQIGEQIGAGVFARVHLACDHSMGGRQVVLKLCAIESDETDILGRLNHPNIISPLSLHDFPERGLTGIVMPFRGTATLAHLVAFMSAQSHNSRRVCIEEFLRHHSGYYEPEIMGMRGNPSIVTLGRKIALNLADALAFAHKEGFIHSDVKPENILLANDQTAKLLDFNLALSTSGTSVRPLGGTYRYMPPEQRHALTDGASIETSVDVYSLAASLIELFHNCGTQIQDDVSEFVQSEIPIQSNMRRLVGWQFTRLLRGCTSLTPERRPSASWVAQDLRRFEQRAFSIQLFMALAVVCPLLFGSGLIRTDAQRFSDGWTALTDGDPVSAVENFTTLLSRDSATDELRLLRACASIETDDYATAFADLRAVEDSPEISALQGYVVGSWSGSYLVAEKYFERSFASGVDRVDVLNNLAVCKERLAEYKEARQLLQTAIQIKPDDLTILINAVRVEFREFDLDNEYNIDLDLVDRMMDHPTAASHAECVFLAAQCYLAKSVKECSYQSIGLQNAYRASDLGITGRRISELADLCPDASEEIEHLAKNGERRISEKSPRFDRFLKPPTSSADYLRSLLGDLNPGSVLASKMTD